MHPLAFMPTQMGAPNTDQYVSVLRKLVSFLPPVEIAGTVTDFEKALINACRIVFPQATHHGCLFHYKQVIIQMHIKLDQRCMGTFKIGQLCKISA